MSEKHKAYVLVFMVAIAVLVAYFRFVRTTEKKTAAEQTSDATAGAPSDFNLLTAKPAGRYGMKAAQPPPAIIMRNLFAPNGPLPEFHETKTAIVQKQADAPLKLSGTVIGGNTAMAIINNRFVHQGQAVGGYRIEKIAPDRVHLVSGKNRKVLEVMAHDEVDQ